MIPVIHGDNPDVDTAIEMAYRELDGIISDDGIPEPFESGSERVAIELNGTQS